MIESGKIRVSFEILLFGLQRENKTGICLGKIENNIVFSVMSLHILFLSIT